MSELMSEAMGMEALERSQAWLTMVEGGAARRAEGSRVQGIGTVDQEIWRRVDLIRSQQLSD